MATHNTKEKLKIAIIDSGVRTNHPMFAKDTIQGFTYTPDGICADFEDTFGHGTAVYGIIRTCCDKADIVNIKIGGIEDGVDENVLIDALDYVYEHLELDIINMSLGIDFCRQLTRLRNIVKKIVDKGTIVIAAFGNEGAVSYPAAFDFVIGVTGSRACKKTDDYEFVAGSFVNLVAKGGPQRIAWTAPDFVVLSGSSFACAHMTVLAAKYLWEKNMRAGELLSVFQEHAKIIHSTTSGLKQKVNFRITKAAIVPFSKEMHSLIRFADMLPFEIVDVYDSKYSAKVGASTAHLLNNSSLLNLKIKNIDSIDWNKFDTLIIGHMQEFSSAISSDTFLGNLVRSALQHKKNIYAFDDLAKTLTDANFSTDSVYFPVVSEAHLPANSYGKLFRITKPVVGVFGTSSRQGKFTLQLMLRRSLIKKGYTLGQIGTEPQSLLFGMEYVYPMGYNSSVYLREQDSIRYLNYLMNQLCVTDSIELILVGSQSGTIPIDYGNLAYYTVSQYMFLLGTQPDCTILVVNAYDDLAYIEKTIHFLTYAGNTKVIALVISPLTVPKNWTSLTGQKVLLSDEERLLCKEQLVSHFKLPVYALSRPDEIELLTDEIVNYFS